MPDLGHELLFGAFVTPLAAQPAAVVGAARRADELGLDLLGIQDHPYQPRFLDTWTLLSALARETRRIRLFPDVVNLPLRPPAVLARSVASLDLLSGGRAELGLGAGAFWDGIEANDGPRRTPGESVDALAEAIAVLRALWSADGPVDLDGRHYHLRGAQPGPRPAHPVEIWIGAYGPRMLRLTARLADGWIPSTGYLDPPELGVRSAALDAAAEAAGRDPAAVRRLYNVSGDFAGRGGGFLQGPPPVWVEQLAGLVLEDGFSAFLLAASPGATGDLHRFAEEVAPAVREIVARERGRPEPARERERVELPDEASRPRADRHPEAPVTDAGREGQQALVQIHDHLRSELAQLRDALAAVGDGQRDLEAVRSLLSRLVVRQNACTVGAFCAGYCRFVTIHHMIEDQRLFPDLLGRDRALAAVLARLEQEHEAIGAVLEELAGAIGRMSADDHASIDAVRALVERLAGVLLSHLRYEEDELIDPIGRLSIVV